MKPMKLMKPKLMKPKLMKPKPSALRTGRNFIYE